MQIRSYTLQYVYHESILFVAMEHDNDGGSFHDLERWWWFELRFDRDDVPVSMTEHIDTSQLNSVQRGVYLSLSRLIQTIAIEGVQFTISNDAKRSNSMITNNNDSKLIVKLFFYD